MFSRETNQNEYELDNPKIKSMHAAISKKLNKKIYQRLETNSGKINEPNARAYLGRVDLVPIFVYVELEIHGGFDAKNPGIAASINQYEQTISPRMKNGSREQK